MQPQLANANSAISAEYKDAKNNIISFANIWLDKNPDAGILSPGIRISNKSKGEKHES